MAVSDIPTPALAALERLPLIYFHHGYDSGYAQAIADLRSSLLRLSDEFIAKAGGDAAELRRVVYSFEASIERRIDQMTPDKDYVEGGLGI